MFKSVLFLHSCILVLVASNPLQGFPSYPVIQYKENYRTGDRPILLQPSDVNSYLQQLMVQNQLTPYQSSPVSYNDYVQRIHLNNILQNQLPGSIDTNCGQDGVKIRTYASNPTDNSVVPNVVNNYFIIPTEDSHKNQTIGRTDQIIEGKTKANEKSINIDKNRNRKCRNRHDTHDERSSPDKLTGEDESNHLNKQSHNDDVKVCRKTKSRNKSQSSRPPKESAGVPDSKYGRIQDANKRNLSKSDNGSKSINGEKENSDKGKTIKKNKMKSNRVTKNDHHSSHIIPEIVYNFNLNEDCVDVQSRYVRNYNDDNIKKYQQQISLLSSDFPNNVASYMNSIMSNQQLNMDFLNANFPYNFDHMYNMQQLSNANRNGPKRKQKINRKTNKIKKQKKTNKKRSKASHGPEKFVDGTKTSELPTSTVPTIAYESQIDATFQNEQLPMEELKHFEDISDKYEKITEGPPKITDESKEIIQNNYYDVGHEDYLPFLNINDIADEYYPDFRSDNIYLSKEDYDWNNFHDRHYYSSNDNNELHRERRRYKSTDDNDIHDTRYYKNTNNDNKKYNQLNNEIERDNLNVKASSEEVKFKPPPPLDFPDFKTEMINRDRYKPGPEIYYQPNNKVQNNKMSSYSNVKTLLEGKNDVETVFGQSKVVKYGFQPSKEETKKDVRKDYESNERNLISNDGITTIVIAKSLPYSK